MNRQNETTISSLRNLRFVPRTPGIVFFFPKDYYLGALRLFLRVHAAASASRLHFFRRLDYTGQVTIGGDPRGADDLGRVEFHDFPRAILCRPFYGCDFSRIQFHLHKDCRAGESAFYLVKESRLAGIEF